MTDGALDHLVYAAPDLEMAVSDLAGRLGLEPIPGGQHLGRGTRNFLLPFEGTSYLELIGPDPEQADFSGSRSFGLDTLSAPRLVGWALRVRDIDRFIAEVRSRGYDPGPAHAMSRQRPDGTILSWRLTDVPGSGPVALLPFLIDWGESTHPSASGSRRAKLIDFYAESLEPEPLRRNLAALRVSMPVNAGATNQLVATVAGPTGTVVLR